MFKPTAFLLGALVSVGAAYAAEPSDQELITMLIGKDYGGTPWVFEKPDEFPNFKRLRREERNDLTEYFVYMSLRAPNACHNTLGLITVDARGKSVLSADMVHHAPAKRCLTYEEFKNP